MPLTDLWRRPQRSANPEPPGSSESSGQCQSSEAEASSSSSAMSIEEENGGSESESDAQELNRAKRRLRTEKARAAALLARQVKRAEAEKAKLTTSDHPAARFKPDLQPNPEINKPGNFSNTIHRRRIRVVYSWFKAWCTSLLSILQSCTNRNSSFCYTVNVVDDTSIRLADLISGVPQWRKSRMVSCPVSCDRF